MTKKSYQIEMKDNKKTARAIAKNQEASLKYATELAREIRGKKVEKVEEFLNRIIEKKDFLPLRKYNKKIGHRKGSAKSFTKTGRYPLKTAKVFLNLVNSVKANADYKGLDAEKLIIVHAFASQGFSRICYQSQGRISGKRRKKKSVHLEIIAREAK